MCIICPRYAAHNSEFIYIKATTVCRQDSSSSSRQLCTCLEIVAGCENLFPELAFHTLVESTEKPQPLPRFEPLPGPDKT